MDFSLTEEQTLLQDSVSRFVQNDYGFEARQKLVRQEPGFSTDHWAKFAELGWLGVPFSEEDGGRQPPPAPCSRGGVTTPYSLLGCAPRPRLLASFSPELSNQSMKRVNAGRVFATCTAMHKQKSC